MVLASGKSSRWRIFSDYGMLGVLGLLCVCCALATIEEQKPEGAEAARIVAARILAHGDAASTTVVLSDDAEFANDLTRRLTRARLPALETISGDTRTMRRALESLAAIGTRIDRIATTERSRLIVEDVRAATPSLAQTEVLFAQRYVWPTFLKRTNLINVAKQNVVIGIIAVGMTMVIITGGIDLSVGSLVALSAVIVAALISRAGGKEAGTLAMIGASLAAIGVCGGVGAFSGSMVTLFKVPPFVVTLAMLWVARGTAFILSGGKSIDAVPDSFDWLGADASLFGIPNKLLLMILLYVAGHVIMGRTPLGRHIYAIGGNRLAARLSGIRVNRVLLVVYVFSGAMAGVGGVILASRYSSGVANYGQMYELYAIAAVVVGGTSLAGGEGKIFGTLIGVFIIAVIQNAMNIWELGDYVQNVVLGLIVLAVVQLDMLKRHGWKRLLTPE